MNDFLKQDVFFFITTVAVVVLAVLLGVFIVYLIRISRKVDYITGRAKEETDNLSQDLGELRNNIRSTGFKISHVGKFINSIRKRAKK